MFSVSMLFIFKFYWSQPLLNGTGENIKEKLIPQVTFNPNLSIDQLLSNRTQIVDEIQNF